MFLLMFSVFLKDVADMCPVSIFATDVSVLIDVMLMAFTTSTALFIGWLSSHTFMEWLQNNFFGTLVCTCAS